ncbi:MAG: acid phosphatase pho5 [Vezdaea aestivalis]|nr:MAG: acid phosphatase pho5 [Vezdaea aestivalis]
MLATFDSLKQSGLVYKGDLAFVNGWNFFSSGKSTASTDSIHLKTLPDPSTEFEQLTTTGPYAGSLQAFTAGLKLRTRYRHLIPKNKTKFWASDSKRVIESGKYFAAGFFGLPWEDHSTLDVIPETPELGGDTLTPGDTCLKYALDTEEGHDYGNNVLMKFRPIYIQYIRQRLMIQNPSSEFTDTEIWSMQEMCGFETIIRGSSNWCDVFTRKEWEAFEYARDLVHYYRGGPGNKYGKAMGWLWLNATRNLLLKGPTAGPLFFSFVHDGDIAPMLAALGLFQQEDHLSVDGHIPQGRKWKTSEIFPMGARIIFERLSCKAEDKKSESQDFVRINVNDGIVAMPTCHNGPGGSCPLGEFSKFVDARGVVAQDFRQICGLGPDAAAKITFLHQ